MGLDIRGVETKLHYKLCLAVIHSSIIHARFGGMPHIRFYMVIP